jgi:lysophospholipase L1-like esterase
MGNDTRNLRRYQAKYVLGAALVAPISPLLFLQGAITRWKIGVLPDAAGPKCGIVGDGKDPAKLFVLGESTVAGLGARSHELGLAGQFARQLNLRIGRSVEWKVLGKNGVTARRTIDELLPEMPNGDFDYILLGLGGNDVMKLTSPTKWRRDMLELIGILQERCSGSYIFIANCPMVILTNAIPPPSKQLLWELSKLHDANIREFTANMDHVFYYPQPVNINLVGFFADGVHPSEKGYAEWSAAMMKYFSENHKW